MVMIWVALAAVGFTAIGSATVAGGTPQRAAWLLIFSVLMLVVSKNWPFYRARRGIIRAAAAGSLTAAVVALIAGLDVDAAAGLALAGVLVLVPLWPRPAALRAAVLLCTFAFVLGSSDLSPERFGAVIVPIALGAVVALVATTHVAGRAFPQLAPSPFLPPARPLRRGARVATESFVVLAIALLAGIAASAILPVREPGSREAGGSGESGAGASLAGPALVFGTPLEPFGSSAVAGGGRASQGHDAVLFRVETERPVPLRAQTLDRWDGRRWFPSGAGEAIAISAGPTVELRPGPGDAVVAAEDGRLVQRITIENQLSLLVAAPVATEIRLPPGHSLVNGPGGPLVVSPRLRAGASYEVRSADAAVDLDDLINDDAWTEGVPGGLSRTTNVTGVSPQVGELADDIAGETETVIDAIDAIRTWLTENVALVDRPPPASSGTDPLQHLLVLDRRGTHEAVVSAFVLMARSLGIPARVAVGFRPGTPAADGRTYLVRRSDAHVWAEVWFPYAGWVPFESSVFPAVAAERASPFDRLGDIVQAALTPVLAVAIVAIAFWAVVGRWRRRRWLRAQPWPTRCYERLAAAGSAAGRPRRPDETPAEYGVALAREGFADERLARVGAILTDAAYSAEEPPAEDRAWVEAVLDDVGRRRGARPLVARR